MRFLCVLATGVLLAGSFSLGYAQNSTEKWTLQECVEHGLQNSIRVRQGQLDVLGSEVSVKQAQMQRLPSLNANTSVGTNLGRSINPFTNQFTEGTVLSQSIGANAGITLFNGFIIHNTIEQSRIDQMASEYTLEETKNQVSLDIIGLYTQVLFNREQLAAAEARLTSSQQQLKRTQVQVEVGVFPEANLLQAQQQVAADELQVVNFQNAVQLSLLQLKQLLMVDPSVDFDIVTPEIEVPTSYTVTSNPRNIFEEAVASQPVVKAADARVESAQYGVKIAEGGRLPSLSAGLSWSTAYSSQADSIPTGDFVMANVPIGFVGATGQEVLRQTQVPTGYEALTYLDQLDFNARSNIGVTLSVPIFNNYRTQAQIDRAKISLEQAKVTAVNTRNTLRQTIEQAYQNVLAAQKTYAANLNQAKAQREVFSNTQERYNLGAADVVEYTQAQGNMSAAEADLIRAKYDYIFKIKILDFYQNKPLTF